jgi:hypothetical protein
LPRYRLAANVEYAKLHDVAHAASLSYLDHPVFTLEFKRGELLGHRENGFGVGGGFVGFGCHAAIISDAGGFGEGYDVAISRVLPSKNGWKCPSDGGLSFRVLML